MYSCKMHILYLYKFVNVAPFHTHTPFRKLTLLLDFVAVALLLSISGKISLNKKREKKKINNISAVP